MILWVPTIAAGAWLSFHDHPGPQDDPDPRTPIPLTAEEQATMKRTMRGNVEALDTILRAWSTGDRATMAAAARRVADEHPGVDTPSLRTALPPGWTTLGSVVHSGMASFADDVAAPNAPLPDAEIPARLAAVTEACVACHQTYRFTTAP